METPRKVDSVNNAELASSWAEEHLDYLLQFAILHTRNETLAADLVQDALVSAVRAYDSFQGQSSIRVWLRAILRNRIIDHFRRAGREANIFEDQETFEERGEYFNRYGVWSPLVSSWGRSPEEELENSQLYEAVQSCITKLPDKLRQVFTLRHVNSLSNKEICNSLGITASNCSVILHRARMAMRVCLEKNWYKAR